MIILSDLISNYLYMYSAQNSVFFYTCHSHHATLAGVKPAITLNLAQVSFKGHWFFLDSLIDCQ